MAEEKWLPVIGFEGLYEVSDLGRVRRLASLRPSGRGRFARVPERVWPGYVDSQGYFSVNLGRAKKITVHRLVCEAFHGSPDSEKRQVAHYDGNKLNNRADNLRWATDSENKADSVRLRATCWGERVWKARLNRAEVLAIRAGARAFGDELQGIRRIADQTGLARKHVEAIVRRRIWKHI